MADGPKDARDMFTDKTDLSDIRENRGKNIKIIFRDHSSGFVVLWECLCRC